MRLLTAREIAWLWLLDFCPIRSIVAVSSTEPSNLTHCHGQIPRTSFVPGRDARKDTSVIGKEVCS